MLNPFVCPLFCRTLRSLVGQAYLNPFLPILNDQRVKREAQFDCARGAWLEPAPSHSTTIPRMERGALNPPQDKSRLRVMPNHGICCPPKQVLSRAARPQLSLRFRCLVLELIFLATASPAWPSSYYMQQLEDPKAVVVASPTVGDDTAALQQAIDHVQETTGQDIVLLPPGRYRISGHPLRLAGNSSDRLQRNAPGHGAAGEQARLPGRFPGR
jgi:hypothetical protein